MGTWGGIGMDGDLWGWGEMGEMGEERGRRERLILFGVLCAEFATSSLHSVAGEYAVEHWHEEQRKHCREGQTADDGCTHRAPHLRTLSGADSHRHHTEDCGESGHHNRTET